MDTTMEITKPFHLPNRADRRKYAKLVSKDPRADICPICGNKALFYTTSKDHDGTVVKCQLCTGIVFDGPKAAKLFPPGIILPYKLDIFRLALKGVKDDEPKETNE